jgi:plastocyanin
MRARRITLVAATVLALVVTLAPSAYAVAVISGDDTRWLPPSVTISRGETVRWRGVSSFHDILAYGGNWSFHRALPVGVRVRRRFSGGGTFLFRCTYHSTLIGNRCWGMCGRVVVRA